MINETIDLYDYFGISRGGNDGGYLTVYAREKVGDLPARVRPAMLVIPGGGYQFVSEREGEPVALRFVAAGYAAFRLNYTINRTYPTPLIEGSMAMAYIRENAEKYCVDPAHVAAVGFSAGGHLTAMLATLFDDENVKKALGARNVRPDAVVLSYPVITTGENTHVGTAETISGGDAALKKALSLETRVTAESSPAFLWHTYEDNAVPVVNSLLFAQAYIAAGVPCELHVFERGWHGLSLLSREENPVLEPAVQRDGVWAELALSWLASRGFAVREK